MFQELLRHVGRAVTIGRASKGIFVVSLVVATSAWLGCGSKGDAGPAGAAGASGGTGSAGPGGPSGNAGNAGSPGATGATGPANTTWWRGTVATPGADSTTPNTFDAGTWGPFNLSGECFLNGAEIDAHYVIRSTDPAAKYVDYGSTDPENASFLPDGGATVVGWPAAATPPETDLEGPYDGTFSALSSDLKTYITGALTDGVNVGGDAGPACQFDGYMTQAP